MVVMYFLYSIQVETIKLSGGAAIDEDSGYTAETAIILQDGDKVYSETMTLADVSSGINSFYRLQIIIPNGTSRYYLFRRWGRVGTSSGGNIIVSFLYLIERFLFKKCCCRRILQSI